MAFFNFFLYLHTWYTGDYSSFSFLLDTLCLLVLIIDNIKWKVKGDYSSWVSNHKLFYHFPLYSNYRNSYFTYVLSHNSTIHAAFSSNHQVQTDSTCTLGDFFLTLVWYFNETTFREPWRNKVSDVIENLSQEMFTWSMVNTVNSRLPKPNTFRTDNISVCFREISVL